MTTESLPQTTEKPRVHCGWGSIAVAIVFGLLNAYVLWNAIGNLVNVPKNLAAQGLGSLTPWWLLILDVAVPVVAYAVAFFIGRRASLPARAGFFLVALAVVACSTVGSIAFTQTH